MNTPAHMVLNMLCLSRHKSPALVGAIALGAVLPDLPMFAFYFVEKVWLQTPEHVIWGERYFAPSWQNFFDVFNSIPVIGLLALVAWRTQWRFGVFLALSMLLHVLADLPLHHDDGHRHFFPLWDWRFASPVSYWDSAHHGGIVASLEAAMVLLGSAYLLWRHSEWVIRGVCLFILTGYGVGVVYALTVWAPAYG